MTPKSPTQQNFRCYGKLIDYPNKTSKGTKRNLWRIVHTSDAKTGWRVAYLILRDKTIGQMGCHPASDETFEPIKGRAVLFVSTKKDLSAIEAFVLDKPLIVYKGIWHNLISLTPETEIKITENAKMTSRAWSFGFRAASLRDISAKIS